jgi:hypothetical protein
MASSMIAVAALAAAQAPAQQPLELACMGAGTASTASLATVNSNAHLYGNVGTTPVSGNAYGTSTVIVPGKQDFSDQVDVRLFNGDDRIRVPRVMLPVVHGGVDGWFKLKNVTADARSIRAKAALGFLSNPKVFIDRVTGTISISGGDVDYSGHCQVIDATAPAKF